jgi:protein O-mannosyl-transferase
LTRRQTRLKSRSVNLDEKPFSSALPASKKKISIIDLLLLAAIGAVILLVFGSTLAADFLAWDDDINITRNPYIQTLSVTNLLWMFTDVQHAVRYKPLSWLCWAVLYAVAGPNPLVFHLANVGLHLANAALLFFLVRRLLQRCADAVETDLRFLSVCTAIGVLLWAVHPLRVEPVAWITGLPYGLSFLFAQIGLIYYLRANGEEARNVQARRDHWFSIGAFAAAVLSYPVILSCVLVLLLIDACVLHRFTLAGTFWKEPGFRPALCEKIPFFALAGAFCLVALYGRLFSFGTWLQPKTVGEFGIAERIMQAFYIWAYYAWKFWLPGNLAPAYTTLLSIKPTAPPFVLSALFVVGVTGLLGWRRTRWPGAFALWLCHLALLIPVLGLTEHPHYPSDRYGFVANAVWVVVAAALLFRLSRAGWWRTLGASAAVALAGIFALTSVEQSLIWQNDITLFTHMLGTIKEEPYRLRLYAGLGDAYVGARQQFALASRFYLKALAIEPDNSQLHAKAGRVLFLAGDLPRAEREYNEALRLAPDDADWHNQLGVVLASGGMLQQATNHFFRALELDPEFESALANAGLALKKLGREEEARPFLEKAARVGGQTNRFPSAPHRP